MHKKIGNTIKLSSNKYVEFSNTVNKKYTIKLIITKRKENTLCASELSLILHLDKKSSRKMPTESVERLLSDKTFSQAEIIKTAKKDDAYHAALSFKDSEIDLVIAVGGDETVNEVLNGLLNEHTSTLNSTDRDFKRFCQFHEYAAGCGWILQYDTVTSG